MNLVIFSFNGISKKGSFFLLYYVFFAVQSESGIRLLRLNLLIRFFKLNILNDIKIIIISYFLIKNITVPKIKLSKLLYI